MEEGGGGPSCQEIKTLTDQRPTLALGSLAFISRK